LILYRGQRRIDGTNVRIVLPPLKDLGFDRNQPPPVPPVEPPKLPEHGFRIASRTPVTPPVTAAAAVAPGRGRRLSSAPRVS